MSEFTWPAYPGSETEFEELMVAIDDALAREGVNPEQRPLHAPRKFWEAFGWGGNVRPPAALADAPGYRGEVLMAKAHRWFKAVYGDKLKAGGAIGYAPYRLANALWRVRAGLIFGEVEFFVDRNLANRGVQFDSAPGRVATSNLLRAIEELPQGLANRLSVPELKQFADFFQFMYSALLWRDELPATHLFATARHDYDQSTVDVLARRYSQARWGAQQAVEKTIKGLLKIGGTPFPTAGASGHNLNLLATLLQEKHGIAIDDRLLQLAACSAGVRYGEVPSSEQQGLEANHAVLSVLEQLKNSPNTAPLLRSLHQQAA